MASPESVSMMGEVAASSREIAFERCSTLRTASSIRPSIRPSSENTLMIWMPPELSCRMR